MTTVAELSVTIGANIAGLERGLQQADRGIRGFAGGAGQTLKNLGGDMTDIGGKLALMVAPLAAVGLTGIRTAANFEDAMAEISVRTGLFGQDLEQIRALALQMGADTTFSAQQAADAFLQLLTSGQSVEQAIATLPAVLDAAAASGEDLGTTADLVTDIMAMFGLNAQDAAMVADSLARAAGASSASMGDLGQGFGNVGSKAAAFGLDVRRTAAILAIFAENGIKGAEAGTQLKSMLTNMSRDTNEVQGAWDALETSLYTAEGTMRPLPEVIEDIRLGLAGMSEQDANRVITDLAGSYGELGLRALLGSQSIGDMEDAMAGAASVSDVAQGKMDTLNGKVDGLKGSFDTFNTEVLTPFIDATLKPLIDNVTDIVNGMTDWARENPAVAGTLVGLVAVAGVTAVGLAGLGVVVSTVGAGLLAMSGPVGLIVLGMGALVGATLLFNTKLTDTLTVADAVGIGVAITLDDMGRRFRIMLLDIEWWTQSAIGTIKSMAGDSAGAMAARVRLGEIEIEKGSFNIGDALYDALIGGTDEFRNGLPFRLPDDLVMQIQNDPAGLADNLSLPTKALLIEAWNAAVAAGDMEFVADTLPLMVAINEGGLIPLWGGELDIESVKALILDELQKAFDTGDTQAMIKWQTLGVSAGIDPAQMVSMWEGTQFVVDLQTGLQNALDSMVLNGFIDLSKVNITTGDTVIDPLTGMVTPQVIPLDQLLAVDSAALADMVEGKGPELWGVVTNALRSVLLVGDAAQQEQVINLAEMIGIDTDSFIADFRAKASELNLGQDITQTLIDAITTGDNNTVEFIVPLLPLLDYDETQLRATIADTVANGTPEQIQVASTLSFGLDAADAARLRADATGVVVSATDGLQADITSVINPTPLVADGFGAQVGAQLAAQIDGMTITANVNVVGNVTTGAVNGETPTDGSFATGLDYVPYDGFTGTLHEGEMILPAMEASAYRDGRGRAGRPMVINISGWGQSAGEFAEGVRRALERKGMGVLG